MLLDFSNVHSPIYCEITYIVIVGAVRARVEPVRYRPLGRLRGKRGGFCGLDLFCLWRCRSRSFKLQASISKPKSRGLSRNLVGSLYPRAHEILMLPLASGEYERSLISRVLPKRVSCRLQPSSLSLLSFSLSSLRLGRYRYERKNARWRRRLELVCNYQTLSPATVTSDGPAVSYPVHPEDTRHMFCRSQLAGRWHLVTGTFFFLASLSSSPPLIKEQACI